MDLSSLPDVPLLQVLGSLSSEELLLCRGVCRRWRSLALSPSIWQSRALHYFESEKKIIPVILRLVPRLESWHVNVGPGDYFKSLGLLPVTTNCAVSELYISVGGNDAFVAAAVLHRQSSLGHLKKVHVFLDKPLSQHWRTFYHQLASTQGLEHIRVHRYGADVERGQELLPALKGAAEHIDPVPASLRSLKNTRCPDPNLHLLLQWHAATLKVVKLCGVPISERARPLLSRLPRLQELHCPLLEDMPALLQNTLLKSLHLHVVLTDKTRPHLPAVRRFLRAVVSRLEELVLQYDKGEERADAVNLVLCLEGAGDAPVSVQRLAFLPYGETLTFPSSATAPPPQVVPLTSVLPKLVHLTHLDLGGAPSDEFLRALDGRVLPKLVKLELNSPLDCQHEWAHSAEVKAVMQRCPQLHILTNEYTEPCDLTTSFECDFCEGLWCHPQKSCSGFIIFSHPEGDRCGLNHNFMINFRSV